MKRFLLPALLVSCLVWFYCAGGDPPAAVEPPPPNLKAKPRMFRPADAGDEVRARNAALDGEIAALEAEAEKLRQEIARAQLASDQAMLVAQQAKRAEERAALLETLTAQPPVLPSLYEADPGPTPPVGDYELFYDELSPHGEWFESADYGYVWQPAVARHSTWRPYTVGCWTACDRGWVWLSEEPFGWAVYHYGRWACHKDRGWIWVPGETWAPAWVAWCRSRDYVGWCPLPPETLYQDEITYDGTIDRLCGLRPSCYIFITAKHFCLPVQRHGEPAARSALLCRNASNITRLRVSRNGVDRSGPGYDWIRQCLGHAPPKYRLTCDAHPARDPRERLDRDRIFCYAPRMRAPWNPLLRPGQTAGILTLSPADRMDATPPDKMTASFREARRSWQTNAAKAMKEAPVRRFTERQENIRTLQMRLAAAAVAQPDISEPASGTAKKAPPTGLTTLQRREQRDAAAEQVASQRRILSRMQGIEAPAGSVSTTGAVADSRPLPLPAEASPGRPLPPSIQARQSSPKLAMTPQSAPVRSASAADPPVRSSQETLAMEAAPPLVSLGVPETAVSRGPQTFRHATTTAIIPGSPASGAQAPGPESPAAGSFPSPTDSPDRQIAKLKEEADANRQTLMDQRNGAPRSAEEESSVAARQQQESERIRQQARAEEQAALLAEARAAQLEQEQATARASELARHQQMAEQHQRQVEEMKRQQETARQQQIAEQHRQRQAEEMASRQEAARLAEQRQRQVEEMQRQQEAARQQQIAEQRQRQAEEMQRQQETARQQQIAEQRQRQAEEMQRQQEAARQQQMAEQHRQRQAEEMATRQEAARQQQIAEQQRQRQAEEMQRQQETARQQREAEQRQKQAEESARQQEAARRQKGS